MDARFVKSADSSLAEKADIGLSPRVLRKRRRLTLESEFHYVKSEGRKSVGHCCVLQVAVAKDGLDRRAIVVSRYFSRRAVARNRARRILRVALSELAPDLEGPFWLVVRPRQPLKDASAQQAFGELRELCERLKIVNRTDEEKGRTT